MKTLSVNWGRMVLALVVPFLIGTIVAIPLWRKTDAVVGSAVGAALNFVLSMLFFAREFIEIASFGLACEMAKIPCRVVLGEFTRGAIYAAISFVNAAGIFSLGLVVSERRRARQSPSA